MSMRSDFLAAVEAEYKVRLVPTDAIVIERSELPEVTVDRSWIVVSGLRHPAEVENDTLRGIALRYLAIGEWRAAHPPVDEAQVRKIFNILEALFFNESETVSAYARRLYLAGIRITGGNDAKPLP